MKTNGLQGVQTGAVGDVIAEIDGVGERRNINSGNNVQVGQSLMAIRSLDEICVDASFKETQLRELRIGFLVRRHRRANWIAQRQ